MRTQKKKNTICVNGVLPPGSSGLKLMVASDLHLEPGATRFDQEMLQQISSLVSSEAISTLIIAGDFLDSLETFTCPSSRSMITDFLSTVGRKIPVVFGVGNHDFSVYENNRTITYFRPKLFEDYKQFIERLRIDSGGRVFLLDNSSVVLTLPDDSGFAVLNLKLSGLTLPPEYYGLSETAESEVVPEKLNRRILWEALRARLPELSKETCGGQKGEPIWKILLVHSPLHLDNAAQDYIREFGYALTVSGHLHNGAVPFWLDAISGRSERGIIGADGTLFPERARNTEFGSNWGLLTLGATKMVREGEKHCRFKIFNMNFPPDFRFLHFV